MSVGDDSDRGRWLVLTILFGTVTLVLAYALWPRSGGSDDEPTLHELVGDCESEAVSRRIAETGSPGDGGDLVQAVDCGVPIVSEMLDAGANPDSRDADSDETALAAAAAHAPVEVVELLVEEGADINLGGRHGATALHRASSRGNGPIVTALLDAGGDVNARTEDGSTPLMWADDAVTVRRLIDAGANPNDQDEAGDTALLTASNGGETAVVAALLAGGADPDLPSDRGHTPVFRAVAYGQAGVLEQLLQAGASPEAAAEVSFGDIGFVWVARSGDLTLDDLDQIVATIGPSLEVGDAVVAAAAGDGLLGTDPSPLSDVELNETIAVFTPLYLASVFGDDEMVRLLLDAGADPTIGTQPTGHLPQEAAEALGYSEMAEMLSAH